MSTGMRARDIFGSGSYWARNLAIAAGCGVCLGVVGPFGSYLNPSRATVIAYWIGVMMLGEVMIGATVRPAWLLAPRLGVAPLLLSLPAAALMAVPLGLVCHAVALHLWPSAIGGISLLTWYGQTLVVVVLMAAGNAVAGRKMRLDVGQDMLRRERPARPVAGNFQSRLPPHIGTELIALQMEDHYVRAHTSKGSALILIPLRQALEELRDVRGLHVHRSWWVARHAVIDLVHDGRNVRLRLAGGLMAPVSRANVAAVRGAGILFAAAEKDTFFSDKNNLAG